MSSMLARDSPELRFRARGGEWMALAGSSLSSASNGGRRGSRGRLWSRRRRRWRRPWLWLDEELARVQRAEEEFLQAKAVECERLRVVASSLTGE